MLWIDKTDGDGVEGRSHFPVYSIKKLATRYYIWERQRISRDVSFLAKTVVGTTDPNRPCLC